MFLRSDDFWCKFGGTAWCVNHYRAETSPIPEREIT
jgi:hypothetical protein